MKAYKGLQFTKMHGLGNDYIYINCLSGAPVDPSALARALSPRHKAVGANGLVLILPSTRADFRMRMFNADGSEGAMCGNAIRCVGKYVYERGLTDKTALLIETASGIKRLSLILEEDEVSHICVDMGAPKIDAEPLTLTALDTAFTGYRVSMGNPHFAIFCENVDGAPVTTAGPILEQNTTAFPDRANIEFFEKTDEGLKMRVWERGSGETRACGTGACAAAVTAVQLGLCEKNTDIFVSLPGGTLLVRVTDDTVFMTGNASFVYDGTVL